MPVTIILGTGQCGLPAVVDVLNRQPGCRFTYQGAPQLPWIKSAEPVLHSRLVRMAREAKTPIYGNAATSYLPYVEELFRIDSDAKVICMRRPRDEVVDGFMKFLHASYPTPTNHWSQTVPFGWTRDPVWSQTFPKYESTNLEECLIRYWDEYIRVADEYAQRWPDRFRIFDPEMTLDSADGLGSLLDYVGVPWNQQVSCPGRWKAKPEPILSRERPMAPRPVKPDDPSQCIVLVPYNTHIHPPCDEALKELERRGYPVRRVYGYAAIDQARNQLATDAMLDGYPEMLWVDSDVGFHPDAVDKLRSHNLPIVAGMYAQKGKRAMASHILPGTKELKFGEEGGLIEILYAATGFLHVRREVYLGVQEKLGLPVCNEQFGKPLIPYFQPYLQRTDDSMWYLAEDYAFSRRARDAGFSIMCDTSIRLWHFGIYGYGWEDAGSEPQRFEAYHINARGND